MGSQAYHETVVLRKLQSVIEENDTEMLRKMIEGEISLVSDKDKKLIPKLGKVVFSSCKRTSLSHITYLQHNHVITRHSGICHYILVSINID